MVLSYGRGRRLTAIFGGFRPGRAVIVDSGSDELHRACAPCYVELRSITSAPADEGTVGAPGAAHVETELRAQLTRAALETANLQTQLLEGDDRIIMYVRLYRVIHCIMLAPSSS